ncbi:hypothetical protein [Mycoplasma parvum]|uniref:Uncharacterized protein n=1 Tax=Mycoplasma parvum str. Indiana TaxID=1403316 RepID=U5NFF4_9MOLU|nr:hypothetical protein [Mycoplasma parvum]AGX88869.1 hypothetical protein PRV_00500 [Mycoplasma parvum str. Indiana]
MAYIFFYSSPVIGLFIYHFASGNHSNNGNGQNQCKKCSESCKDKCSENCKKECCAQKENCSSECCCCEGN